MEPTQWAAFIEAATPAAKGVGAIILCLLGGKGLWEVLVTWQKIRDAKDTREMAQEDLREAAREKRIATLEAAQAPLIERAALLGPCQEECARLRTERDEWKAKAEELLHKNAQLETAKMGWDFFQSDPTILRRMADKVEEDQRAKQAKDSQGQQ